MTFLIKRRALNTIAALQRHFRAFILIIRPFTRTSVSSQNTGTQNIVLLNEPRNAHRRRDDKEWDRAGRQVALASATGNAIFCPSDDWRARWQEQEECHRDGPRDMGGHSTSPPPAPREDELCRVSSDRVRTVRWRMPCEKFFPLC